MRKRFLLLAALIFCTAATFAGGRAKYVFFFIGDGMGVNQVNGTETYLAALEGRIGVKPLCFTQFPHSAFVTTYSGTNGVTDSAAAGTALATGRKSKNGTLGLLADRKTPVTSVAVWAKDAGAAVGVTTSVSVDHATPAAFYAHQPRRQDYYAIGCDLAKSGFDFFAGAGFLSQYGASGWLYDICKDAGYAVARGYGDFLSKKDASDKLLLLQSEEAGDRSSLPYAIDRTESDLTLPQVTEAAVSFLSAKKKNGFFLMVEGGKIDWACHSNDIGTVFRELADMDSAVCVAYDFYKKHPKETLIVVTADHETGGLSLGRGPYELRTQLLRHQRMSVEAYAAHVKELHKKRGAELTWDDVKDDLRENWGFFGAVKLSDKQEARLRSAYEATVSGAEKGKESLYASIGELADVARDVMAECALIGWQSGGHSNGFVPAFAIGAGAENFDGQIDNTQIPVLIAKAAGWKVPAR